VHHGHDPDSVRLVDGKHGIGEAVAESPANRREHPTEPFRLETDLSDHRFDVIVEPPSQIEANLRVVLGGLGVLSCRGRVEGVRFHRPTIWRMRAETSSPGIA
jgi:hypothetical protein